MVRGKQMTKRKITTPNPDEKYYGLPVLKVDDDDDVQTARYVGMIGPERLEKLGKAVTEEALHEYFDALQFYKESRLRFNDANDAAIREAIGIAAVYLGGKIAERTPEQDRTANVAASRAMQAVRHLECMSDRCARLERTCRGLGLIEGAPGPWAACDASGPGEPVVSIIKKN
jgi:hypothetical protein